jgi:hypothetical protein
MPVHVIARDKRLPLGLEQERRILEERNPDVVWPDFDAHAKLQVRIDDLCILVAAGRFDGGQRNAFPIDEHLYLVRLLQSLDLFVAIAGEAHLNLVFAVLWKSIWNQRAAAGAEGQTLDAFLLCDVRLDPKRISAGCLARGANGEAGNLLRGRDVAVEKCRRKVAHRHIVEAMARFVVRQQSRGVEVHAQEIPDRVLIFGAIEPAKRFGASWIWRDGGSLVD